MSDMKFRLAACLAIALSRLAAGAEIDKKFVPHRYTAQPPGPAISAEEAARRMTVPEGFTVEVVACEPEIVNPVAMTFDDRGRIWITESVEYPRSSAGPGRDRVKILEDTNGDGRADKFTVFAEGLNIPSGIAVGAGGVWVANAPDILFMQDTDGDGRADKQEVVLTGFGRGDTHEGPNSLTWGPDGWLYGLNGVFNPSHIEYRGRSYDFTCATWRIHPRTRDFEIFCQGTSNPWGIAFNDDGEAFVSACVIDHLWHLTETGYYHRQAGAYPPFTWKIGSIADHKHQFAAYSGIHWFDSDAYPERFREKLFMGNIHGSAINVDRLERNGSTYKGHAEPDFLLANDPWFMPVVQKTGPDGCLYILDWYDQYHCYQDARRVPEALDRRHGRLYRVRYNNTPRAPKFDLTKETDDQLIERLRSPNIFYRDLAQRLLWERRNPETIKKLEAIVLDEKEPRKTRMHALWARIGCGPLDRGPIDMQFHYGLYMSRDPALRTWYIRSAGNESLLTDYVRSHAFVLAASQGAPFDARVAVQAAIAIPKLLLGADSLLEIAANCGDDPLIPHIVWNNLQPFIEKNPDETLRLLRKMINRKSAAIAAIVPRALDRALAVRNARLGGVSSLLLELQDGKGQDVVTRDCLRLISQRVCNRELSVDQCNKLHDDLQSFLADILERSHDGPLFQEAAILASGLRIAAGMERTQQMLRSSSTNDDYRLQALTALIAADESGVLDSVQAILRDPKASDKLRRGAIEALGRLESPAVAEMVIGLYDTLPAELKPQAVELLTQRVAWARMLVMAVAAKRIGAEAVNANQVLRLHGLKDEALAREATAIWGTVRTERNPDRERVVAEMRKMLQATPGDPHRGQQVFTKLCGQCHKMYGQGQEVGPDITANGRASFEQLLSNVFDPSLVIGNAYQARIVVTADGRTLTGLLAEDSPQRVVLKVQGGKLETVPRSSIEEMAVSRLSLMPEGVEKQYQAQELADLFAFLVLDKPPSDPAAKLIPGSTEVLKPQMNADQRR
ncbi:MAG TPA: PVC-type heme-binding CxxCH protein [Pirellulales bacterium]|jgi:putative membrane-bound dehydrogenase-like protein|nr:PVC-type heme-binding CxxCH protein [Pirellulales bacterium]